MMSPFTFTSTCSMMSARIGVVTDTVAISIVAAKSCFFIIFNILAYPDTLAQVAQQAGHPAEHAPFRTGIFFRRPKDLVLGEPGRHLASGGARRPPRWRRLSRLGESGHPHVELQGRGR